MNAIVDILIPISIIFIFSAVVSVTNGFASIDFTINKDSVHISQIPLESDVAKVVSEIGSYEASELLRKYTNLKQSLSRYNYLENDLKSIEDYSFFCMLIGAILAFYSANRFWGLDDYMNSFISSILCLVVYVLSYLIADKIFVRNLCESYRETFLSNRTKKPDYDCSISELQQYILSEFDRICPILDLRLYALEYIVDCKKKAHTVQIIIIIFSFVFAFFVSQKP